MRLPTALLVVASLAGCAAPPTVDTSLDDWGSARTATVPASRDATPRLAPGRAGLATRSAS